MKGVGTKKRTMILGPRAWNVPASVATRLWGKWAKDNILRSQRTINQLCGLEKITGVRSCPR